jgi:hypothetical protein
MKRWIVGLVVAVFVGLLGPVSEASVVTVTSNPLWTNVGSISPSSGTVTISGAAGEWRWGGTDTMTGPDGDSFLTYSWDFWITGGRHGQLIGFVGPATLNLNDIPRVIFQNDPGLFVVGTGEIVLTGVEGTLWLGMNDDYASFGVSDNGGSITVNVDGDITFFQPPPEPPEPPDPNVVPEPTTLIIWSVLGGLGMAGGWYRRRKPV